MNRKLTFSAMFFIVAIGFFAISSQLATVHALPETTHKSGYSHIQQENSTDSGSNDGGSNSTTGTQDGGDGSNSTGDEGDSNHNGVNDTIEKAYERQLQVESDAHSFSASSKLNSILNLVKELSLTSNITLKFKQPILHQVQSSRTK